MLILVMTWEGMTVLALPDDVHALKQLLIEQGETLAG